MAQQRRQLERFCNELSHKNQKMLLTEDQGFCAPTDGVSGTQCKTSCVLLMGRGVWEADVLVFYSGVMFLGAVLGHLCIKLNCEFASSSCAGAHLSSLSQGRALRE